MWASVLASCASLTCFPATRMRSLTRTRWGEVKTWTTGKITSTVNEVTPPAGVISSPDSTYSVALRVWDTKQRESIPGDPAYVEVVRAFTFVAVARSKNASQPEDKTAGDQRIKYQCWVQP